MGQPEAGGPLLEVSGLTAAYGPVQALRGIDLRVPEGKIIGLIGLNGSGKTSVLRAISGLLKPSAGDVRFRNKSLLGLRPETVAKYGIGHVAEGHQVFAELTVEENIRLGGYHRRWRRADLDFAFNLFPVLATRRSQLAGTLSGGEQQFLVIARALAGEPAVLMLDEPSYGVAPLVARSIGESLRKLIPRVQAVLLAEQDAMTATTISDYVYVLKNGKVIHGDEASRLRGTDVLKRLYFG